MSRTTPRAGRLGARPAALVALALVASSLAACAPVTDPAWTPPSWPSAAGVTVTTAPPPVDSADVPGLAAALTAMRLRNDAVGVQVRASYLPGPVSAAFNAAVQQVVRDAIDGQSSVAGVPYSPTAGAGLGDRSCVPGSTTADAATVLSDPALGPEGASGTAVVCDIVVAAGGMLAQRLRVVSGTPDAIQADTSTVVYIDTVTGETTTAERLWSDDAAAALSAALVEALRRDAGSLGLAPAEPGGEEQLAAIRTALTTTVPGADSLVVTVAAGFVAPELAALGVAATTEPLAVEVSASLAASLMSPFGQRLLEAIGEPFVAPGAVPAAQEWLDCALMPCVALTYDDGPSGFTPRLLDDLRDRRAAATFYMLGDTAAGAPETVRRVAAEGHEIGGHTWNHPRLPQIDDAAIANQLSRTRDLLRSLSGQPVATFRPPYGEYDRRVLAVAGRPAILWTVDTRDWAGPADDVLIDSAVSGATPGGIILFHDTHERTVRVAPAVIDGLRDRGFSMATVTQLFGGALPSSGAWRAGP